MKIRKTVTPAKAAANKNNAKKLPGATSIPGKERAKKNALTHGFFARELVLNDEETQQVEKMRRSLHPQLAPNTVMQGLQFGVIVVCIGRCKLALRLEMRHISRVLSQDSAQRDQSGQTEGGGAEWYLSGRQELRQGIRLLEAVKQEFLSLGRIDEKSHIPLDKAFGPQLRQLLTQWTPPNATAVKLAHHLTRHAKTSKGLCHPP